MYRLSYFEIICLYDYFKLSALLTVIHCNANMGVATIVIGGATYPTSPRCGDGTIQEKSADPTFRVEST